MNISFERLSVNDLNWDEISKLSETNVFQTLPWLNHVSTLYNAERVVVGIKINSQVCGYFFGLIVKKLGLRILGSPFRGWSTYFMGFSLKPGVPRSEILKAFPSFAFDTLHCHYVEITDPYLQNDFVTDLPYKCEHLPWLALDLSPSEEVIFANMKDTGRRGIRKAQKSGVLVEEAFDTTFADDYFAQYIEVMSKRSLVPTYNAETVRDLIESLLPTGSLLLLRAKSPDGVCIATGIFLGCNKLAIYWGGASWQQYQGLHPNELIFWQAMKTLKNRGAQALHLGGEAEQFKRKFGSSDANIFRLRKTNNLLLDHLMDLAALSSNSRYRNWFLRKL